MLLLNLRDKKEVDKDFYNYVLVCKDIVFDYFFEVEDGEVIW